MPARYANGVTQTRSRPVRRQPPNRPKEARPPEEVAAALETIALRVPSTRIVVRRNARSFVVEGRGTQGLCWFVIGIDLRRARVEVHAEDVERHAGLASLKAGEIDAVLRALIAGDVWLVATLDRRASRTRIRLREPGLSDWTAARYRCLLPRRPGIRRQRFSDYRNGDA